ncbi:MAG: class I SAM-dependent methyltransferase [Nitrososphaerales archaeon]
MSNFRASEDARELLYVVTNGRYSLRKHVVKMRFVKWGDSAVCVLGAQTSHKSPDWLENLLSGSLDSSALATGEIYGKITMVSVLLDPHEIAKVTNRFIEKYGASFASERYYDRARPVVLEYKLEERPSNAINQLEFDLQARRYTSLILENPISSWQRQVTISHLKQLFKPGETILEIGCGTGIETIPVAKNGPNIVAVDISQEMLRVLDTRVASTGLKDKIRTRKLSASGIAQLAFDTVFPKDGFDGAFSHFGTLNLERDLEAFSRALSSLLKPESQVSFAVWNRICASDILAHTLRNETALIRERVSGVVRASEKAKYSLDTRCYTPKEFAHFFLSDFKVISYFALPTLIPPSEYARRTSGLLRFRRADYALGKFPFFRSIGDNYVITMRKLHGPSRTFI